MRRLVGRERRLLEQRGERDYLSDERWCVSDEHWFVNDEHWCVSHPRDCYQRRAVNPTAAVANRVSASRQ